MRDLQAAQALVIRVNLDEPSTRDEWINYGAVITDAREAIPSKPEFGRWLKANGLDIKDFRLRSDAMWLYREYDTLAPLFEPGQALARVHNPKAIHAKYSRLKSAQQPQPADVEPPTTIERAKVDISEVPEVYFRKVCEWLLASAKEGHDITAISNSLSPFDNERIGRVVVIDKPDVRTATHGIHIPLRGDEPEEEFRTPLGYYEATRYRLVAERVLVKVSQVHGDSGIASEIVGVIGEDQ
jgi:hypothetical protein